MDVLPILEKSFLIINLLVNYVVKAFEMSGYEAGLNVKQVQSICGTMLSNSKKVEAQVRALFLDNHLKGAVCKPIRTD